MYDSIATLCKKYEQWVLNHPKRSELVNLLVDNGVDEDEADVVSEAIISLMDDPLY